MSTSRKARNDQEDTANAPKKSRPSGYEATQGKAPPKGTVNEVADDGSIRKEYSEDF